MVDIWGRSRERKKEEKQKNNMTETTKMIKDEISKTLNLTNVDKDEIVLFQNKYGKFKTSNVTLDDLLTKNPTADDNSIVVFSKGKLSPSILISAITEKLSKFEQFLNDFTGIPNQVDLQLARIKIAVDNLITLRTDYDNHIVRYNTLQRKYNITDKIVEKFFGKENVRATDVKTLLQDINTAIEELKSKLKILHPAEYIKEITHTVKSERVEWVKNQNNDITDPFNVFIAGSFPGYYRFTAVSDRQLIISGVNVNSNEVCRGTDTITCYSAKDPEKHVIKIIINPVDPAVTKFKFGYIIEYLGR